jgi:hypothetical protein
VEQTGDVARRKANRTATRYEAGNFPRNACDGTPGGIVHGVSECATGPRAVAAIAAILSPHGCSLATTSVFISSPSRSLELGTVFRVAVALAGFRNRRVSRTHQAGQMPPKRAARTMMCVIKMLGGSHYAAWPLLATQFARNCSVLCSRPASITSLAAGQTYHIQGWTIVQTSEQRQLHQRCDLPRHDREGRQEQGWRRTGPGRCPAVLIRA